MKATATQYAQTLYELTKDKPEDEVVVVIEKYINNLKRRGLLGKITDIIKKFEEIYNKENGIIDAKVFIGREVSEEIIKKIKGAIKNKYHINRVDLEIVVDKKLKGGVKIVVGEEIMDNSVVGRLERLKKKLLS